jgi:hypothetical protein
MSEHVVKVAYTEKLMRSTAYRYWRKTIGSTGFILLVVIPMIFAIMWIFSYPQWALGLFGGLSIAWAGITLLSFFRFRKMHVNVYRRMENKTATFTFSESGVKAVSDNGSSEFGWKLVDAVYEYPDVWLLSLVRSTYLSVPTETLDDETKSFIRAHIAGTTKDSPRSRLSSE